MLVLIALCACSGEGLPPLQTTWIFETPASTEASEGLTASTDSPSPLVTSSTVPLSPTSAPSLSPEEFNATLNLSLPPYVSAQGLEALALVNQWRIEIGLWPLALNEELSMLAQNQADYLETLEDWPDNIHEDALGGVSDDRARRIGWPGYDASGQAVAVTEIIAYGQTPADAVEWWSTSEIHTWVIEREYYREAGVGTVDRQWGTSYVIVVGSRPNVLPVTVDPVLGNVYLSTEQFSGGYNGIIGDVEYVQFLPAASSAPDPGLWLPFNQHYNFPQNLPGAVAYSDGAHMIIMPADQMAWLPHTLPENSR